MHAVGSHGSADTLRRTVARSISPSDVQRGLQILHDMEKSYLYMQPASNRSFHKHLMHTQGPLPSCC